MQGGHKTRREHSVYLLPFRKWEGWFWCHFSPLQRRFFKFISQKTKLGVSFSFSSWFFPAMVYATIQCLNDYVGFYSWGFVRLLVLVYYPLRYVVGCSVFAFLLFLFAFSLSHYVFHGILWSKMTCIIEPTNIMRITRYMRFLLVWPGTYKMPLQVVVRAAACHWLELSSYYPQRIWNNVINSILESTMTLLSVYP